MKYLRRFIFAILTCALIACIIFAAFAINGIRGLPQDAYASDWTAIFIIEHLKATDNNWPSCWADLQDEFDRMAEPSHYAWSFAELQQRVDLKFHLTSEQVREADPPVEAIRLTSGRRVSYDGDPNVNLREYLRTGEGGMESIRRKYNGIHKKMQPSCRLAHTHWDISRGNPMILVSYRGRLSLKSQMINNTESPILDR